MVIPEVVQELLDRGFEVSMSMDNEIIEYDLKSETKSEMKLRVENGQCVLYGRYGETEVINNVEDLAMEFIDRYRYKRYGSEEWIKLVKKIGFSID